MFAASISHVLTIKGFCNSHTPKPRISLIQMLSLRISVIQVLQVAVQHVCDSGTLSPVCLLSRYSQPSVSVIQVLSAEDVAAGQTSQLPC